MAWHLKRACRWASMRGLHHICSIFSQIKRSHRHIKYGETIDTHWRKVIANYAQSCTIVFFSCRPFRPRPGHGHIHPATATHRTPGHGHPATATRTPGHTATPTHGHTVTRPHGHTATRPHGHTATTGHTATRSHGHTAPHGHTHGHTRPPGHPASQPPVSCVFDGINCFELLNFFRTTCDTLLHGAWCYALFFPGQLCNALLMLCAEPFQPTCNALFLLLFELLRRLATHSWSHNFQLSPATYNTLLVLTFSGPQLSETIQKRFLGTMFPNFSSNLQALGATRLTISSSMSHALDATPLFSSNHATCSWCYFSHALNLMVVVDFDMEHA